MVLPGKNAVYKESVISKFPIILSILSDEKFCKISDLQIKTENQFSSIAASLPARNAANCLFALGKIELNESKDGVYIC